MSNRKGELEAGEEEGEESVVSMQNEKFSIWRKKKERKAKEVKCSWMGIKTVFFLNTYCNINNKPDQVYTWFLYRILSFIEILCHIYKQSRAVSKVHSYLIQTSETLW